MAASDVITYLAAGATVAFSVIAVIGSNKARRESEKNKAEMRRIVNEIKAMRGVGV